MTAISMIGLGTMGTELARVLIEAGHDVTVWNRTPERCAAHAAAGAAVAASASAALRASPTTMVCIRTHSDTRALLETDPDALAGRTIIELSTGGAGEADALLGWIRDKGARCLIGMISTFPSGIGEADSAIITTGDEDAWEDSAPLLRALAGKSSYIGTNPRALAAIYASLFLPRQGFMFGMIYGALICEKAGVSMQDYVDQLPLTIKVVHDYYDVFAASVPAQDFSNPPASLGTYHAAFEDTLNTCTDLGVPAELPELLHALVKRGIDAGLGDEQITALTKIMRT